MPLSPITRILIFAVALRFAAHLATLVRFIEIYGSASLSYAYTRTGLLAMFDLSGTRAPPVIWALHAFPQDVVYVVDVIFVEGLYRVWRNLKRARVALIGDLPA